MKKVISLVLALLVLTSLATVAFAADSPQTGITVTVIIGTGAGQTQNWKPGDGPIHIHIDEDTKLGTLKGAKVEGEDFTISNAARGKSEYVKAKDHAVDFDLTPISGSVTITADYEKPGDGGNTSPNTGDNTMIFALVALIGLFGAVVATKKLVKEN